MSVEEKIEKELKGRKKQSKKAKKAVLPEVKEEPSQTATSGAAASPALQELLHLQARSDSWTLWSIGLIVFITMLAFLGLWPDGEQSWFVRVVWKLLLAGSVGAVALLFSRTTERIQKRIETLANIVNDELQNLGERYRTMKFDVDYLDSDATTKALFVKAAAVVAAVSIIFII